VIASGFAVHGWGDASDIAQIFLALAAAIGVPFAVVQLRRQGTASRLAVADRLDARWTARLAQAEQNLVAALGVERLPGASDVLGNESIDLARRRYDAGQTDVGIRPDHVGRVIPYVLLSLLPSIASFQMEDRCPHNEDQYRELLLRRCHLLFPVLDALQYSQDPTRNSDLASALALVEGYVNAVNDVVEMIEQGDLGLSWFLGKRHYAVLREIHVLEPFILWKTAHENNGRWGLRVLLLGAAARKFHWTNRLHCATDVRFVAISKGAEYALESYGYILRGRPRKIPVPYLVEKVYTNRATARCFSRRAKSRQTDLVKELTALIKAPGEAASAASADDAPPVELPDGAPNGQR
jgi:hypothetical protein